MSEQWYFTFGYEQTHPATGESLKNCYVVIDGDIKSSREIMTRHFGYKWAFQYPTAEKAGVDKYGLTRIYLPDDSIYDPDHLNPEKGGNRPTDDYW